MKRGDGFGDQGVGEMFDTEVVRLGRRMQPVAFSRGLQVLLGMVGVAFGIMFVGFGGGVLSCDEALADPDTKNVLLVLAGIDNLRRADPYLLLYQTRARGGSALVLRESRTLSRPRADDAIVQAQARRSGQTLDTLARRFGVHRTTVMAHLRRIGVAA